LLIEVGVNGPGGLQLILLDFEFFLVKSGVQIVCDRFTATLLSSQANHPSQLPKSRDSVFVIYPKKHGYFTGKTTNTRVFFGDDEPKKEQQKDSETS